MVKPAGPPLLGIHPMARTRTRRRDRLYLRFLQPQGRKSMICARCINIQFDFDASHKKAHALKTPEVPWRLSPPPQRRFGLAALLPPARAAAPRRLSVEGGNNRMP